MACNIYIYIYIYIFFFFFFFFFFLASCQKRSTCSSEQLINVCVLLHNCVDKMFSQSWWCDFLYAWLCKFLVMMKTMRSWTKMSWVEENYLVCEHYSARFYWKFIYWILRCRVHWESSRSSSFNADLISDVTSINQSVSNTCLRSDESPTTPTTAGPETISDSADNDIPLWSAAWKVWINIGTNATRPPDKSDTAQGDKVYVPSQHFLTALLHTFPALFEHIKAR